MKEEPLCFNCNRQEGDHPLLILTQGLTSDYVGMTDGLVTVSDKEVRIQLSGRSWRYEGFCEEFVGQVQLTLF